MVSDAGRDALPRSKSLVGTLLGLLPDLVLSLVLSLVRDLVLSLPAGRSPGFRRVVVASKILKPCCTPVFAIAPRVAHCPLTNECNHRTRFDQTHSFAFALLALAK